MSHDHEPYGEHAAHHTARLAARTRAELRASMRGHLDPAPLAGAAVAVLGLWLGLANPVLGSPFTGAGWDTALRDELVSVPVILAGLVLARHPQSTAAAIVAVAAGLTLIAFGVWAGHDLQRMAVDELATGFAVVVAALVARLHLRR